MKKQNYPIQIGQGNSPVNKKLPLPGEVPNDAGLAQWIATGKLQPGTKSYRMGACFIILSPPVVEFNMGWHMSISCKNRYPTWDEVAQARYCLIPDELTMVMHLPPRSEYISVHQFCFQLRQLMDGQS